MKRILLAAGLLASTPLAAHAQNTNPTTTNMQVSATAVADCSVTAGNLAFGNYRGAQLDQQATISIACTSVAPTSPYVTFGLGANADGTQRRMANGTARLNYNLYSDSGRTAALAADTQLPITNAAPGTNNAYAGSVTVYGRIPANQDVVAGSYSDTVVVTLTY